MPGHRGAVVLMEVKWGDRENNKAVGGTRNDIKEEVLYKWVAPVTWERCWAAKGRVKTSGPAVARDEGHRTLKRELEDTQNKLIFLCPRTCTRTHTYTHFV